MKNKRLAVFYAYFHFAHNPRWIHKHNVFFSLLFAVRCSDGYWEDCRLMIFRICLVRHGWIVCCSLHLKANNFGREKFQKTYTSLCSFSIPHKYFCFWRNSSLCKRDLTMLSLRSRKILCCKAFFLKKKKSIPQSSPPNALLQRVLWIFLEQQ